MLNTRAEDVCFAFTNTQEHRTVVCKGTYFVLSPHPHFLGMRTAWCLARGVSGSVLPEETGREHGGCPRSWPSRQGLELPRLGAAALNAVSVLLRLSPGPANGNDRQPAGQGTHQSVHKACEEEPQKLGCVRMLVKHRGGGWGLLWPRDRHAARPPPRPSCSGSAVLRRPADGQAVPSLPTQSPRCSVMQAFYCVPLLIKIRGN